MLRQQNKHLNNTNCGCYVFLAVTVLAVGRENPGNTKATPDAISVFFVVAALFALERLMMARCTHKRVTFGLIVSVAYHRATMSMVALAGPSSDGPGSFVSGFLTPVRAIASERENSCDSFTLITKEAAFMATIPTKKHPKFADPQLSYDCRRRIYRARITALHMHIDTLMAEHIQPHIPYIFSYIHDDIEAIDKELISLGLFDSSLGKRRRK
ncbi:ash family protein [Salmonella enterica]|uniref:Uncharacterized protein n=1 Tax=Salmonella enterica TaxID=28901 RepID=A0A3J0MYE2_SALER|nr:hypothetical protein [Salmonella enterica]ECU4768823.1 hypothetical protein [Salmonella enterica subsp. enterica]EDQ1017335.1 ash family protein [Salmonella enterica subsp. houtenae serovar 50:z4,z23:-]EDV3252732.1 ash family protein [Salmonella enterica subsp. houtenae]EDW0441133.1 ash family protein [Salmonella enterica subsp. arizonae serovar 50:z4,z23:-]HAE7875586.1 ash family protein [Salmonella enterica subsp. enterica serovar 1,9,12:-:-]HCZ1711972.1 ash family protein [Salmonella en